MFNDLLQDNGVIYISDSNDEIPSSYEELDNGVQLFNSGFNNVLIWKYYTNNEIRSLVKDFKVSSFNEAESGRRTLWLSK